MLDNNHTSSVVLNDLVIRVLGSSASDSRGPRLLLDSDCILAYVLEPHVVQSARTETMNTLGLVGTNDNISAMKGGGIDYPQV